MNKKIGKFKLWHLIAIGAAIGLGLYLYNKESEPETQGESLLFGGTGTGAFGPIDPDTGIPYAFQDGFGETGETLDMFLARVQQLRDGGLLGGEGSELPPEVITETIEGPGLPGPEPASNRAVKAAQKAARKARKNARKERKRRREAEHRHTQKPKKTGAAASIPNTHHSPKHPVGRLGSAQPVSGPGARPGAKRRKQPKARRPKVKRRKAQKRRKQRRQKARR
jgi:hypothetical protein